MQNLIVRGHKDSKLSALRMTDVMDGGPVYMKEDLSLEGTAQEILTRQSDQSAKMIGRIIKEDPEPREQEGEVVVFERRTPDQSQIPNELSTEQLYDFIRMLDAEGYPPAFIKRGGFRYEYTSAMLYDGHLEARVRIIPE